MGHICVPNYAVKSMLHTCACKLTVSIYVCGMPWTIFVAFFPEILYNISGNSVEMNSETSLTRLVLPAFCMMLITGVEVT